MSRPATSHKPSTRNPGGDVSGDEVVTDNGDGNGSSNGDGGAVQDFTPAPAPGVFPPSPPPPPSAAAAQSCFVTSGPTYTPSGTIPVTIVGSRKKASFSMAAAFGTDASKGRAPRCCEVRQYIKWDKAFHDWNGGPPHSGFPSSSTFDTWYEDRDTRDTRYGHRSGPYSDPTANCGDEYRTGKSQDQANGDTYCGRDAPGGPNDMTGTFNFQLKVIDTCNGDAEKASSSVITINW